MNPVTDVMLRPVRGGGGVWIQWINPTDLDYDHVRVVRVVGAGPITGPSDPNATLIAEGPGYATPDYRPVYLPHPTLVPGQARRILDTDVAPNAVYTYAMYASNADGSVFAAAAEATIDLPDIAVLQEPDIVGLLIGYLKPGLWRALQKGTLRIPDAQADQLTEFQVLEGPPRMDIFRPPSVSIHLDEDAASDYFLGDAVDPVNQETGVASGAIGYFSVQNLSIHGWAGDNPEVRRSLYRTLKGLLMAARHLLTDAGVEKLELSGGFREEFEQFGYPMFYCEFRLRAWVLSQTWHETAPVIEDIDVTLVTP